MNGLLGYVSAMLTCYACMSWNDAQLASMVNPQESDIAAISSIADIVVSSDSETDVMNAISSGDFSSSAKALVTAASNATQLVSTVVETHPDPMVLTALSGLLQSVIQMNAAASLLGNNPNVIPVRQCADAMKLTRDVLPWPDGWGIVQDPSKPNYSGFLNCYITDGTQYVPMTVTKTV